MLACLARRAPRAPATPRRSFYIDTSRPSEATPYGTMPAWTNLFLPKREVAIIGAAFSKGQPRSGTELGPTLMRKGNLQEQLETLSWKVHDEGDIILPPNIQDQVVEDGHKLRNANAVGAACELIAQSCQRNALQRRFVLTLGGDHSIAMGSIAGVNSAYPDGVRVLWIDSHADCNTPATSPTGNMHGMPVAYLMGVPMNRPRSLDWMSSMHRIKPEHLAYIALRDVDEGEKRFISEQNVWAASMVEVDRYGIHHVVKKAIEYLDPTDKAPLHVSFDIDALDVSHAPSTGTAVPGGLSLREGRVIVEEAFRTNRLVSMDIVEINVIIGDDVQKQRTVESALLLARFAAGDRYIDSPFDQLQPRGVSAAAAGARK